MPVNEPARKKVVSMFRYPIADHEAMNNIFPATLRELARTVDVHHFSYRSETPHPLHGEPGIHFHEFPIGVRRGHNLDKWIKTLLWFPLAVRVAWWARRNRAACVYIEESITFLPLIVRAVSGRPIVISGADIFWDVYLGHGFFSRLARKALLALDRFTWRRLHGVITRTEAMKRFMAQQGVAPERVLVVPEACEPEFFHPMDRAAARREWGLEDGDLVIVHHGVLHPNKNLDHAFEYLKPVFPKHPRLRLWIAGDGPLRKYLEQRAAELGIADRVRFLGWLPDVKALNTLLNAADISLVMRHGGFSDHFQITANLLHSLACGCAILAVRLDGIAEHAQEGVSGLLFAPDSGEEFSRQVERLIEDSALRGRLREGAARVGRERLDPRHITDLWVRALLHFAGEKEAA
ncbi:MAG: glycosyltransferase [Kiritimatiellae bacterium]|nr:glycosyltransferase [Kiritimatiellia bacterium]